jgi:hypothetical protein
MSNGRFNGDRKDTHSGKHKLKTDHVWIYVDTNKEVGDVDHLKVIRDAGACRWVVLGK